MDMFKGDWAEKALALFISLSLAVLLWIACWGAFIAADSWFLADKEGSAQVYGRKHSEAWIQTIYHSDGKGGGWTQVIYHPESWAVAMRMGTLTDNVSVSKDTYNHAHSGQQVRVNYRRGRISGDLYITKAFFFSYP